MKYLVTWVERGVDPNRLFDSLKEAKKFAEDLVQNGRRVSNPVDKYMYDPLDPSGRKYRDGWTSTIPCTSVTIYEVSKVWDVYEKRNIVVEEQ